MAALDAIVDYLDSELRTTEIADHANALNGLQLANGGTVQHVAAAVDYSLATIRATIDRGADLLIVHHGMFWAGPSPITGRSYEGLALLLGSGVAVYASHIPLDLHPAYGNNSLLARELGLTPTGGFATFRGVAVGVRGEETIRTDELVARAEVFCSRHGRTLLTTPIRPGQVTRRWGVCTGAGASSDTLKEATELGLDTLIVGEGPHHTAVEAVDLGITILYAGHYATETLGVTAIAREVGRKFDIAVSFVEAPTGL